MTHQSAYPVKALSFFKDLLHTIQHLSEPLRSKNGKRIVRASLVMIISFFVIRMIYTSWNEIANYHWQINWLILLLGFGCWIIQYYTFGFIWGEILRRMGHPISSTNATRIFLQAEFVRYIPGNIWHILARMRMAENVGISSPQTFASMIIELATRIISALFLFLISLFAWQDINHINSLFGHFTSATIALIGIPLLTLGLHPRILRWLLNKALKLMKKNPLELNLRYRDLAIITGIWMVNWIVGGIGFWLTLQSVTPLVVTPGTIAICSGIYAIGWDIGFLTLITPSGLFFREGAIAALLVAVGLISTPTVAGILALMAARIAPTLAELVCVGWVALNGRSNDQMEARK
jgi:uncharacterized membrane protein YbhN (UPF0104 family)